MSLASEFLQPLVGLPLSIVRRAADMRIFHFGSVHPHINGRGTIGDYALHVQCPWRLAGPEGVLTGTSDRHLPPRDGAEVDYGDPRAGALQDVRLKALLGGYDEATKSHLSATGSLIVTSVRVDRYFSADISFLDGIHLQLFPDGSLDEDWRFFKTNSDGAHFVIEAVALPNHEKIKTRKSRILTYLFPPSTSSERSWL